MIPVTQTSFGQQGNCFSACLASLFECDISEVPNFTECGESPEEFWAAAKAWLFERGWGLVGIALNEEFGPEQLDGYLIVVGKSARGLDHATLWHQGQMIHDPHPDRSGILKPEACDLLYPLDPSRFGAAQPSRVEA